MSTASNASGRAEAASPPTEAGRPFDRQHPVRGGSGGPRTIFRAPPTLRGVLAGDCTCSSTAASISRPRRTPVYPLRPARSPTQTTNGSRSSRAAGWRRVSAYPRQGVSRLARQGLPHGAWSILHGSGHVHLTAFGGAVVNLRAPARRADSDRTTPRVTAVSLRHEADGRDSLPEPCAGAA